MPVVWGEFDKWGDYGFAVLNVIFKNKSGRTDDWLIPGSNETNEFSGWKNSLLIVWKEITVIWRCFVDGWGMWIVSDEIVEKESPCREKPLTLYWPILIPKGDEQRILGASDDEKQPSNQWAEEGLVWGLCFDWGREEKRNESGKTY